MTGNGSPHTNPLRRAPNTEHTGSIHHTYIIQYKSKWSTKRWRGTGRPVSVINIKNRQRFVSIFDNFWASKTKMILAGILLTI